MQKYVLFIGIDISKNWIDVCLSLNGRKKEMPHLRVLNTRMGFQKMLDFICKSKLYVPDRSQWVFLLEHTGVYSIPLGEFLKEKELAFSLLHPLDLKYSMGLKRGKNDKIDAQDIAYYGYKNREELNITNLPSRILLKIKALLTMRRKLVKHRHGIRMTAKELSAFTDKEVHGEVLRASKISVKQISKLIRQLEKDILTAIAREDELQRLYDLVTSIKGVGLVIGASMLVYTVGFTAFKTSRQFAVYVGVVPFGRTSGTSLNVPARVSHMAHKKLKGIISCGASVAMRYDKQLKAYYKRRIAEGKNKFVVQNAVRAKFINVIFAVVKRGTPYVELGGFRA